MKKLLLSALTICLITHFGLSQITFTSADLQVAGKTYVTKTDTLISELQVLLTKIGISLPY